MITATGPLDGLKITTESWVIGLSPDVAGVIVEVQVSAWFPCLFAVGHIRYGLGD